MMIHLLLSLLLMRVLVESLDDYAYPLYVTSVPEGNEKKQDFFSVALQSRNVSYSMTAHIDSRSSNFFSLNRETGSLSTVSEIDREFMAVHYFKIRATSFAPSFTTSTMVQINVEDVNDNGPIFEQTVYNASVKESIKVGSSIITVRANDADAGENGRISYFLDSEDFRIDPDKGIVSSRRPLDREKAVRHYLSVLAKDNGSPPSSRRSAQVDLLISVIDENDNHPQFEKKIYYIDLKEDWDWRRKPIIGNISASDADDRDNAAIKYTIIGGNNDNIFSVNSENGNIRVQKNLDRENEDHYKLIVRAQDLGNPPKSNTTQVLIKLLDVNDNPPKFPSSDYYQSVAENVPKGYSVMQLTAFDPDLSINSRISYSLANVSSAATRNKGLIPFDIDKETGWISTTTALDRETSHAYRLFVLAEDNGLPRLSSTATVNINVLDRNDNDPHFPEPKYEVRVSESAKLGAEIITLSAIDNDEDSQLRYEIAGGNTRNRFSISTQQGRGIITVAQPLDFKFEKYFYLNVNAIDSGGRFGSAVVTVNVTDSNNHAPSFENTPYMADVFEDTPVGSTVLMLLATDLDFGENARVSYTLEEYSDAFDVESESGALIVKNPLDRERVATYILSILVEDHGVPDPLSDRTEIEISVLDINDNAPQFSSSEYRGSVYENAKIGTSILDVVAIDKDFADNAKIQYRFPSSGSIRGDDNTAFSIDPYSGVLRTKKKLDRETKEVFELIVEAFDGGIPEMSSTSSVIVSVLDVNDNPPKFKNDTLYFTLSENMPIGSVVGVVKAVDPDIGDNSEIVYELLNSPDKKYFSMQKNDLDDSIIILSQREFDYETDKTSYKLLLQAESHPLQSEISIIILITDQNDNLPDLKDFKIIFNHPNEFFSGVIGVVPAFDKDPTSQLSYKFTYGNSAHIVRLNESNGDIRLSPSFYSNVPLRAKIGVLVSDGRNEVRANLFLKVNYVSNEMLENSVTLRLKNISKMDFLTPYFNYLLETLSVIIPCNTQQIHVFSIKSDVDNILNITFSISVAGIHEERYLSPSLIKERIFLQSDLASKLLILEQTPFDENLCVQEPCLNFEECHTVTRFGKEFDYISDDAIMFRSIEPITTYKCVCPPGYTGMTTRYTCDVTINMCYSSPCLNGARCVSKENDYSCICSSGYVGKNCEIPLRASTCSQNSGLCKPPSRCVDLPSGGVTCQNCSRNYYHDEFCQLKSRSFSPGTYIAFNSIKARNFLNLTLQFASQDRRGLLFYNGRLNGEYDFMSLSYEDRTLRFAFSLGDTTQELTVQRTEENFSDGQFHSVELIIENEHITLSHGSCDKKLSLQHQSRLSPHLKCANQTAFQLNDCNAYLGNCRKSFDLSGPLLLGGIPDGKDKRIQTRSFAGCIKNVAIDQVELDMNAFVHDNGSVSGCPEKRNFCMSSPCKNGGVCSEGWGSYQCICHRDWDGKNCNTRVSEVHGFTSKRHSEITYKKDVHQIQLPWFSILSFKTTSPNGSLLSVQVGKTSVSELKVHNGFLFYSYMNTNVTIMSKRVDDGMWHNAQVKWMSSEVWLSLDYGQREITENSQDYLNGKIVSRVFTRGFKGCIRNVRVGNIDGEELSVALQKQIEPCRHNLFKAADSSNKCKIRDVTTNVCLDVCKLDLCENGSRCKRLSGGYECECLNPKKQSGRYCRQEKEQICPHHWWGSPVCGPCNCDPAKGFKESCNKATGECSCKKYFYRGDPQGSCKPCLCSSLGSKSQSCDISTGQCNCKSGIIGRRCDSCSHQFAELGTSGCSVVYGNCPAETRNGIKWRRTPIGSNTTAKCPKDDSKGAAVRVCGKNGWEVPITSGCIHDQFLKLKFTTTDFDQEPWKNIFMAVKVVQTFDSNEDLYKKDLEITSKLVQVTLQKEIEKENFDYAHMKERNFLSNLLEVISWLFKNPYWPYGDRLEIMELLRKYGRRIAQNMATTFTNPLEIISSNVIFGLDSDSSSPVVKAPPLHIPKYNNYMKRPNSWNKVSATLPSMEVSSSKSRSKRSLPTGVESVETFIQYSEFNTSDLPDLDRNQVAIHDLRWGTKIRHFSNVFSLQVVREFENPPSLPSTINYRGQLLYAHDRLYCAYLDATNWIWTSLDCESAISRPKEDEGDTLTVSINCTCASEGIFTVIEELVEKQNDYLETAFVSVIFLSLTLLAVFISLIVVIILFSFSYKNSISIHRNIALLFVFQEVLILLCVTFNASMIDYDIICKLVTMALHYFSITCFIWMLIDSIHIYRMLKELRDINHGKMSFYTTSGYGLPAVIIGLTVGVSGNNYGSASFCWLSFANLTTWSMFIPEIICTIIQVCFIFASLNAVFNIRGDIEDFSKLRRVFFINAGLLPLISSTHIAAYILMNFRSPLFIFVYSGCALGTSLYLLFGFVFGDPLVSKPLLSCSCIHGKQAGGGVSQVAANSRRTPGGPSSFNTLNLKDKNRSHSTRRASRPGTLSKSSLNYHTSYAAYAEDQLPKAAYLGGGGDSLASTSTSHRSSSHPAHFKESSTDDDKLYSNMFHSNLSESDSDIERRSLDLASSHSSDEDNDPLDEDDKAPSSIYKKTLFVNDYPSTAAHHPPHNQQPYQ